jgi:hypothetical protein
VHSTLQMRPAMGTICPAHQHNAHASEAGMGVERAAALSGAIRWP